MYTVIAQNSELRQLLALMEQHSVYFLDTEFIRVKTRYPKLGLIQLNINQQIFLIDPLKLNLDIFWQKIFSAQQNVFHACGEDVAIIAHRARSNDLNNVFDTQIALRFLGYGNSMGYQAALEEFLDVQIYKYESRSDWLARPLSDLQLDYAANDVIYLADLYQEIKHDLDQDGLFDMVRQDSRCFVKSLLKTRPPEEIYLDYARPSYTRRQLAQLQQLCQWREELSIKQNIPISFILKNHELNTIIKTQPSNDRELTEILDRHSRYTPQILKLLHKLPPTKNWPKPLAYNYQIPEEIEQQIETLVSRVAEELNIPSEILMFKRWYQEINYTLSNQLDEQTLNDYLLGWRYDIITQPILKILYNEFR